MLGVKETTEKLGKRMKQKSCLEEIFNPSDSHGTEHPFFLFTYI